MNYDNIRLDKGLYTTGKSFSDALESIDPSENYIGTDDNESLTIIDLSLLPSDVTSIITAVITSFSS